MSIYGDRTIIENGVKTSVPVDDAWVLAYRSRTLLLAASSVSVAVDEAVSITVQLRTPMLVDGSYQNVAESGDVLVSLSFDDGETVQQSVTLDGAGAGSLVVSSALPGSLLVDSASLPANQITIEVA